MSLFVVKHQHSAETCPAGHPEMAPFLVAHVSPPNAAEQGVTIHGEAVVNGGHTLFLIVDAPDQGTVERYMTPFTQVGTVDVLASSTCEQVVARAAC
jgi:hypothetical protein